MKLPTISVVTPTLNQARFIETTILSVLNQDYPGLEYLVMDGGSTDGTIEILERYSGSLKWVSQKDRGQSDALNKGFNRVRGEILAFLNSDDLYEPGALQAVGEFFRDHSEARWATGKCRIIDACGLEIRKPITAYKNIWLRVGGYRTLLVLDFISQPATFWHRSVLEKVGSFDVTLHYTMDYDYSLRVAKSFELHVINRYLASFRVQPDAKSGRAREHFAADLATARRHTHSKSLLALHKIHNVLILTVYHWLRR